MAAATVSGRAEVKLSPRRDRYAGLGQRNEHGQAGSEDQLLSTAGRKRKTSTSSASKSGPAQRQKTTRACDYCKGKKTRCTGTLPCLRCTRLSLPCEYNAAYSRGLPPEPLPALPGSCSRRVPRVHGGRGSPSSSRESTSSSLVNATFSNSHPRGDSSTLASRNSPDPVTTDLEGNYLGPSSGISFLNRVWQRLHQDESSAITGELQNECSSRNTSVFMFGDKPYPSPHEPGFMLPSFEKAQELVDTYFDHAIVTYRFLHRGSVETWLKQVYDNDFSFANMPTGPMVARTAIVLMVFAVATLYEEQHPGGRVGNGNER